MRPVRVSIKLARLRVQGDSATATWSEANGVTDPCGRRSVRSIDFCGFTGRGLAAREGKTGGGSSLHSHYPPRGAQRTLDGEPVRSLDELKTWLGR